MFFFHLKKKIGLQDVRNRLETKKSQLAGLGWAWQTFYFIFSPSRADLALYTYRAGAHLGDNQVRWVRQPPSNLDMYCHFSMTRQQIAIGGVSLSSSIKWVVISQCKSKQERKPDHGEETEGWRIMRRPWSFCKECDVWLSNEITQRYLVLSVTSPEIINKVLKFTHTRNVDGHLCCCLSLWVK